MTDSYAARRLRNGAGSGMTRATRLIMMTRMDDAYGPQTYGHASSKERNDVQAAVARSPAKRALRDLHDPYDDSHDDSYDVIMISRTACKRAPNQ